MNAGFWFSIGVALGVLMAYVTLVRGLIAWTETARQDFEDD